MLGSSATSGGETEIPAFMGLKVCRERQIVNNEQQLYKLLKHKETEGLRG